MRLIDYCRGACQGVGIAQSAPSRQREGDPMADRQSRVRTVSRPGLRSDDDGPGRRARRGRGADRVLRLPHQARTVSRAYDFAVLGEEEPQPPQSQAWYRAMEAEADIARALSHVAAGFPSAEH